MGDLSNPANWVTQERQRLIGRSIKWLVTWFLLIMKRADDWPVVETG
jgi:hypothetical protein